MTTTIPNSRHLALRDEADIRLTRSYLRQITEDLPFDRRQVADILLAVSEACINGVRYTSRDNPDASVTVITEPASDHLMIEVLDNGTGFHVSQPLMPEPMAERGRGIALMHALMDRVDIESNPSGTRVRLVKYYSQESR